MNHTKIIKHENPVPIIDSDKGDILKPFTSWSETSTGGGWYSKFPIDIVDSKLSFPLYLVNQNSWKALSELLIMALAFKEEVEYKCPYNEYLHSWAVPTHIFTDDVQKWIAGKFPSVTENLYMNKEYMQKYNSPLIEMRTKFGSRYTLRFTKVQRALLGAGYTIGEGVLDGYGQIHDALILLDNGDFLGTKVWMWFSKNKKQLC